MPLFNLAEFSEQAVALDAKLRKISVSKKGRALLTPEDIRVIMDRESRNLYALNPRAKVVVLHQWDAFLRRFFLTDPDQIIYFVTLVPKQFAVSAKLQTRFDSQKLSAWVAEVLSGMNYSGHIEAAFYTNADALPGYSGPMISWHAHVLVWGASQTLIKERKKEVNGENEALVPGKDVFHYHTCTVEEALERLVYFSKPMSKEYRVMPKKQDHVNPETGEISRKETGRFHQEKRELRPGGALKMLKIFGDLKCSDLMICSRVFQPRHIEILDAARTELIEEDDTKIKNLKKLILGKCH